MKKRFHRRPKRDWSEPAFVATTLLFLMLSVGCGTSTTQTTAGPAKAPAGTPKPAAKASPPDASKVVDLSITRDSAAPTNSAAPFKLFSVEAWEESQRKAAAKPEAVTPSMRPVVEPPTIAARPATAFASSLNIGGATSAVTQTVTQAAVPAKAVKPAKSTKPAKEPAKASTSVLLKTAEDLVYTRGNIWAVHWISDPDFVGLGLYPKEERDQVVGRQFVDFLKTKGPMTRDLLVAGYVHMQWGDKDRSWKFYNDQNLAKRILGARFMLGILCELDRLNHGEVLKVTTAELFKLIDERPLMTSYTDERNLCPAL
jgi:hypothetical protein